MNQPPEDWRAYFYPRVLLIGLASYAGIAITVPLLDSAWPIPLFLAACLAGDAVVYVRAGRIQEANRNIGVRRHE